MQKPKLVYTTFIRTSPKKLWAAITKPEFTRQYWAGLANVSDWKKGSSWQRLIHRKATAGDWHSVQLPHDPRRGVEVNPASPAGHTRRARRCLRTRCGRLLARVARHERRCVQFQWQKKQSASA